MIRPPRVPALALVIGALVSGCGSQSRNEEALVGLRDEVAALRDSAAARIAGGGLAAIPDHGDQTVLIGLRLEPLRATLERAATLYFDDVRLHIRDTVVVTEDGEVRVRVGPVNAYAGRWTVNVSILRIDARLRADSLYLEFDDPTRLGVHLAVHVTDGSGDAMIEFDWDAARVTSVVCGDFSVRERFSGTVEPRTYRVDGAFVLETDAERVIARPVLEERIGVSPQPTAASWERVRDILDRQNHIFRCGLALSPPRMEAMLRDLLIRGFRFHLPETILRPLPLPASIRNEVDVAGRQVRVEIRPITPHLTEQWLWLGATIDAAALTDAPIRVGG